MDAIHVSTRHTFSLAGGENSRNAESLTLLHCTEVVSEHVSGWASAVLKNLHEKFFVTVVKTSTAPATPARRNLEGSDVAAMDKQVVHAGAMVALYHRRDVTI